MGDQGVTSPAPNRTILPVPGRLLWETVEADILLNDAYGWTVHPHDDCVGSWSVEGVATHEWGHVFGLGHVAEAKHPLLTMSPGILPCQNSEATLGLGDVRALRSY